MIDAQRCRICRVGESSPGHSHCVECLEMTQRMAEIRRWRVEIESRGRSSGLRGVIGSGSKPLWCEEEPAEPCVLYGLLTAGDVRELIRRRKRFAAHKSA